MKQRWNRRTIHPSIQIWLDGMRKNCKVQVILLSTILQSQLQYLVNDNNAFEMWAKLITIHEQTIQSLVKQLNDVKETITSSAICSKVINSLPTKFNSFRIAWDSVTWDNQNLENLTARLLKEKKEYQNTMMKLLV